MDTCGLIDASRYDAHAADVPMDDDLPPGIEQHRASSGLARAADASIDDEEEEDGHGGGLASPASLALR